MMSKKKNTPEIIKLSSKDLDNIQLRLLENSLGEEDKKIICSILATYQWLYCHLQKAKCSIKKLKSVFGLKTEKRANLKSKKTQNRIDDSQPDAANIEQNPEQLLTPTNKQDISPKKE